jgi:hypothetical protein
MDGLHKAKRDVASLESRLEAVRQQGRHDMEVYKAEHACLKDACCRIHDAASGTINSLPRQLHIFAYGEGVV